MHVGWIQKLAALSILFTAILGFIRFWLRWVKPASRAKKLLPLIRAGEAAIEELGDIRGGIAPLLAEMQEVFRDLKRQKAEVARIEIETMQRVANRTDALERALGSLKEQAARDTLTGLYNRRMLDDLLRGAMDCARQDREPLTVMMIDVDDFKLLNDTLGHAAGDEFLRSLGQLIRSTLRDRDMAFRYGGDEFVVLLPHCTPTQAAQVGDRLTSLVDALARPLRVARPPRLSIGTLSLENLPPNATVQALIAEADRLLYDIKLARKAKRKATAA
jgi:diguanylate cyclase (GGDEF)-like protein